MRVLQVLAGAEYGRGGGMEEYFVDLTLALHRAGVEQRAIIRSNPDRQRRLEAGGLPVRTLKFGGPLDVSTHWGVRRDVAAFRPDVIVCWARRAARFCPSGRRHVLVGRWGDYHKVRQFRRCDHLVANTPDIRRSQLAQGWPEDRAHLMVNFARIDPSAEPQPRAELDTPEDAPLILAMGRLHPKKGFDTLIRAVARTTDHYLWLAGDGPLKSDLVALAESVGVADRIRFLGWREDRDALLMATDLCAIPSRYEPFGNVIIQAWAHGKPVVAAGSTGPGWLIRNGEDGMLVPVDDVEALGNVFSTVSAHPELSHRLAQAGLQRHREAFSEEAVVSDWQRFLRQIATGAKGASLGD